jgi:membrane peptidoglycan carboxypeptidase
VVANGGLLVKPKLVTEIGGSPTPTEVPKRVLRADTAATMRTMMEGVVLNGTGRTIRLHGWSNAGKTGTAQIFENGHYAHMYNASFMGFAPVQNPALVAIVTINGTTGNLGMGALAAGPVWAKIMDEALRLYNVPKDLPELPDSNASPLQLDDFIETAEIEGNTGPNILEEDPSAMPKLADIPVGEEGAAAVPQSAPAPGVSTTGKPSGKEAEGEPESEAMPASPVSSYTGPVVPDFRGKAMRVVVREAYSMGLAIRPEGSGVARMQAPAPGSPLNPGATIRVLFAR